MSAGDQRPAGATAGSEEPDAPRKLPRRGLLFGGAAAGLGALAAAGAHLAGAGVQQAGNPAPDDPAESVHGSGIVPFHGDRQAGITTAAQAMLTLRARAGVQPMRMK